MKIEDKTKREIENFNNTSIKITGNLSFKQKDTIERSTHYYLGEYESGEYDEDGFKKYFYNITRNPTNTTAKAIDFDTSDIRFLTAGGGSSIKTWFFARDFKFWFKDKGFGKVLNKIFKRLAQYGSAVIKTIEGEPHVVDLRNFIIEQDAESIADANYVIELHPYSGYKFYKKAEEKGWDNADEVLKEFKQTQQNHIMVYERYGPVKEGDKYSYKRVLLANPGERKDEQGENIGKTFELSRQDFEPEDLPYKEFHLEKVPGRWLGVGVPEILYDAQMRMNELINLQVKGSYWASKRIFQTQDEGISSNVLTDVSNGDVLHVEQQLTPVLTEERNLAAYNTEQERWLQNRNEQTFAQSVLQGEKMPAGTPLGSAQMAAGMAKAYFDFVKQNIAQDVKDYLYDEVIPYFKNRNNGEHIINLTGEDFSKLKDLYSTVNANKAVFDFLDKNGRPPSQQEMEMMTAAEKTSLKNEKQEEIPEGFYDDVEYKLDIIITGEQEDTRVQASNLQMALQAISSNQALLKNPVTKKILRKILEKGGISLEDLETDSSNVPSPEQVAQTRTGGGVSRPNVPATPTRGQVEQRA